jgi:membrane protease YdiL (CAAX protease family)
MNSWVKILVFFALLVLFLFIFSAILFLIFPESLSGSKIEFDTLMSNNYGFLLLSQVAMFLGIFSAIFFVSKFFDKRKPAFLNSMLNPKGLLNGTILGVIAIFLIILLISLGTKVKVTFNGFNANIVVYIVLYFLVAISEEAMSRGFIFTNLYNQSNRYVAIIISSLIFSLMHAFNSSFNWIGMLNIYLIGIFFCQLYLRRMDLSIPIGFHFTWNLFQGTVFGFSVSGFTSQGIFKIESISGSKFAFEGFGLEGSLISTLVITFFIVYFYITNTRNIMRLDKIELSSKNIAAAKV